MKKKVAAIIVLLAVVCTSMAFAKTEKCKECKGTGYYGDKCKPCNGKGTYTVTRNLTPSERTARGTLKSTEKVIVSCQTCGGSGRTGFQCIKCNGRGYVGQLDHDHDHEHEFSPMLWISYAGR